MQNADNVKTLVPLFASKNHKEKKTVLTQDKCSNTAVLADSKGDVHTSCPLALLSWQTVGGYIQYAFEYMTNIDTP